jgi:hypothetical protein
MMPGQRKGKGPTDAGKIKAQVERDLVDETVLSPDLAMAFTRIFNRDGDTFSRIFSRGGTSFEELKLADVSAMDDAAFTKFAERLRVLQDAGPAPEGF